MPATPKVAYVAYEDGFKAVVAVDSIKDFEPADCRDTAKNKMIYWRTSVNGEVEESYFPGDVLLLGTSFSELIKKMQKNRIAVPDSIFYESDTEGGSTTRKVSKRTKVLSAPTRKRRSASTESSDEELVERKLLRKEQECSRALRKKIKKLEEKLEIVEQRNGRLQDLLHNKIDSLASKICCHKTGDEVAATVAGSGDNISEPGTSTSSATHDEVSSVPLKQVAIPPKVQSQPVAGLVSQQQGCHPLLPQQVPLQNELHCTPHSAEAERTSQSSHG